MMIKHAFPVTGPTAPVPKRANCDAASLLSIGLTMLLLLGGCNKQPAAPAPAAGPDTSAQAPPPPAPSAPMASTPMASTPAAPAQLAPAQPGSPQPGPAPIAPAQPGGAPAPVASAEQLPPPPPPPVEYTVPQGTPLAVRMEQEVSAKNNNVGDSFSGALAQSVVVRGVTVLRAGAPVIGTVVAAKGQGRFKGEGELGISIRKVGNYAVTSTAYEKTASGKGKRTTGFIAGGGGGGALIGGLAGGGKGALIGGLIGAGAGTAGAAFTGNKNVSIPAETVVTFRLAAPITIVRPASQ